VFLIIGHYQSVLGEVSAHAGHKVLNELGNLISLVIGNLQEILDEQLRPHLINVLNIIIALIIYIKFYIIRILNYFIKGYEPLHSKIEINLMLRRVYGITKIAKYFFLFVKPTSLVQFSP